MYHPRAYPIEAHPYAATVYLTGAVSVRAVLEVLRRCEELPPGVWLLRVDIAAADRLDSGTHTVLAAALRRWRERRAGVTQVLGAARGLPSPPADRRARALSLRARAGSPAA